MLPTIDLGAIAAVTTIGTLLGSIWKVVHSFLVWTKDAAISVWMGHRMFVVGIVVVLVGLLIGLIASLVSKGLALIATYAVEAFHPSDFFVDCFYFANSVAPLDVIFEMIIEFLALWFAYYAFAVGGFGYSRMKAICSWISKTK